MKEKTFLNIITYGPLVFIPFIVATLIFFSYQTYNQEFENKLEKLQENIFQEEKKNIENKVQNVTDFIVYQKSEIKNKLTNRVQERVEMAFNIATNIYNENKDKKSEKELKKMIKDALRAFIWNDGESFIWVVDFDGVFHLAPSYLRDLEGISILNFKDATGRLVIQEEIAICKTNQSGGFIWDTFTKPSDPKTQYEQVAFVKPFGHYNWYFGSGEYLDTATKKTDKELFAMIDRIDQIGNNYVFLFNSNGDLLVNSALPQFVGIDTNITDELVKKNIDILVNQAKIKDKIFYTYDWFNKKSSKVEKKYSYFQKVPNTNWIIGSGFLLSDIENKVMQQKAILQKDYKTKSNTIFYIAILIIVFSLLFSLFISHTIKKSFTKYKKLINHQNNELHLLNNELEQKVQIRTLELQKMKDKFEALATTDSLTNINNRYALMNALEMEIHRAKRYNTPLCVIMYDIDFFKKVNDTFGHDAGDSVLIELSNLMKQNLRDVDIIGRYGGEEFMIILPNTPLEATKNFAERLRIKVEQNNFQIVGNITISMGVVEVQSHENIDEVFKRVDNLLYVSKNNGRNQISF
jgi:diguanylate cyclase (GGDEF)-like protein